MSEYAIEVEGLAELGREQRVHRFAARAPGQEIGTSTSVAFDHSPLGADAAMAVPARFAAGL
jgi:hypothetical protein